MTTPTLTPLDVTCEVAAQLAKTDTKNMRGILTNALGDLVRLQVVDMFYSPGSAQLGFPLSRTLVILLRLNRVTVRAEWVIEGDGIGSLGLRSTITRQRPVAHEHSPQSNVQTLSEVRNLMYRALTDRLIPV